MFFRKFREVLCPFAKVQNKEKSDKFEINCRPSVLRSTTVRWAIPSRTGTQPKLVFHIKIVFFICF